MAIKSTFFLLAFVLLATRMASSLVDVEAIETKHHHDHHHHHHHHHYSTPPAKAPARAPAKAPAHTPKKAPTKAPIHPPVEAPTHPPVFHPTHVCVEKCETRCRGILKPRKWCMQTCTACCAKFKCVPSDGSKEHYCKNWDNGGVMIRGKIVECPRKN